MIHWKRLVPYLLINVVVSAVTVLLVLLFWEQARSAPASSPQSLPSAAPTAQATLPPLDEPVVKINIIIGVGDLPTEVVRIQRQGEHELSLLNWTLKDQDGLVYTFQDLRLLKDAEIRVYSRPGVQKSSTELFWGQSQAVWRHGETARLYDSAGNLRAEYLIP